MASPVRLPVVPTIVLAQLFGTSLWFSANSAADDLLRVWALAPEDIGRLTNAVQLGFILGTLGFSLSGLADRFRRAASLPCVRCWGPPPTRLSPSSPRAWRQGIALRFLVGASLAGVYPLGMKLVVSWVPERSGAALAQLVGMLTLGTALPHGVRLPLRVRWPSRGDPGVVGACPGGRRPDPHPGGRSAPRAADAPPLRLGPC